MPSLINTTELDTEFPVPGQDNDSQGFRDNFTNVKTNLDTAKTEIETLQNTVVTKNADTTFLTTGNGDPVQLIKANLKSFSTVASNSEQVSALTLDFNKGNYQVYQFQSNSSATIIIDSNQSSWPTAGRVGKITLELTSARAGGTTISFNSNLNVKFDSSWQAGTTLISNNTNPVFIEVWTRQGGTTLFARNLGEFN